MKIPSTLSRPRALLWTVPILAVLVASAVWIGLSTTSSSRDALPNTSAQAVVGGLKGDTGSGYSGTLVADTSLGLPTAEVGADTGAPNAIMPLVSGSYTMRYYYGGADQQRLALLGPNSEKDYLRAGAQSWEWDSGTKTANRASEPLTEDFAVPVSFAGLSPQQLAERAVASIDAGTKVSLGDQSSVAGQRCYQLVLEPGASSGTKISAVRIYVDGATHVPLGVKIFARGREHPVVDVSFSSITYKRPAAEYFAWSPPADVQVSQLAGAPGTNPVLGARDKTFGSGWTAVARYETKATDLGNTAGTTVTPVDDKRFGKGVLLQSPVLSILSLRYDKNGHDTERTYVGAVDPETLYKIAEADS